MDVGWWAPIGSVLPEACFSGFFCPGAAGENGGAKPIIVADSRTTTTEVVEYVSRVMTLDMAVDDYNETSFKLELAKLYQVPPELISLDIGAGSLQITMTIVASPTSTSSNDAVPLTQSALIQKIESIDDASLGMALSDSINASIVIINSSKIAMDTRTEIFESNCPLGYWCSAGEQVACGLDTYQPQLNANSAQGCIVCMANGQTNAIASIAESDCTCKLGFVEVAAADGSRTCVCPPGKQLSDLLTCVECPIGSFKDSLGNQLCKGCPKETTTIRVGATIDADCVCIAGMYDEQDSPDNRTCVACQQIGTMCTDAGVSLGHLPISPGYWRQSESSLVIRPCHTETACLGSVNQSGQQCAPSQQGVLCAVCAPGYFGGGDGILCESCVNMLEPLHACVMLVGSESAPQTHCLLYCDDASSGAVETCY